MQFSFDSRSDFCLCSCRLSMNAHIFQKIKCLCKHFLHFFPQLLQIAHRLMITGQVSVISCLRNSLVPVPGEASVRMCHKFVYVVPIPRVCTHPICWFLCVYLVPFCLKLNLCCKKAKPSARNKGERPESIYHESAIRTLNASCCQIRNTSTNMKGNA